MFLLRTEIALLFNCYSSWYLELYSPVGYARLLHTSASKNHTYNHTIIIIGILWYTKETGFHFWQQSPDMSQGYKRLFPHHFGVGMPTPAVTVTCATLESTAIQTFPVPSQSFHCKSMWSVLLHIMLLMKLFCSVCGNRQPWDGQQITLV